MKAVQIVKLRYGNSFSKISEAQKNVHLTYIINVKVWDDRAFLCLPQMMFKRVR